MNPDELARRFKFHPVETDARRISHELVREELMSVALYMDKLLPEGREKSTVMTKLEEAMFWGNAALARAGEIQ